MIEIGIDARKAQQGGKQVEASLAGVRQGAQQTEKVLRTYEGRQSSVADRYGTLIAAGKNFIGVLAALGIVTKVTGSFIAYENALVDVQTTTSLTSDQSENLVKSLRDMSTVIPRSTQQLADLANAGSQLGVKGVNNLEQFTEDMARLSAVTDLKTPQQVIQLGRLLQAAGEPVENITKLGASIDALGDKTGASANEILSVAGSLITLGEQFNISSRQAVAISAALVRVGADSSAAGLGVAKLLGTFRDVVDGGGPLLTLLSTISGETSEEFAESFRTDAVGALQKFLAGMKQARQGGADLNKILQALGIEDVRLQKSLLPLITGHERLADALETVKDEEANLNQTFEDSQKIFDTTANKWVELKNSATALASELGESLAPALKGILDTLRDIIKASNDWVKTQVFKQLLPDVSGIVDIGAKLAADANRNGINVPPPASGIAFSTVKTIVTEEVQDQTAGFAKTVENLAAALNKIKEPAEQARLEIADLVREMDTEIAVLNRYGDDQEKLNEERERAIRLARFQVLAEAAFGAQTELAAQAVREYEDGLNDLNDARRRAEGRATLREENKELDEQIMLFGKSRLVRENSIAVIEAQIAAERAFGVGTAEAGDAVEAFLLKLEKRDNLQAMQNIFDGVGDSIGNMFEDIVFDAENALDIVKNTMLEISRLVFQQLVTRQISGFISNALGAGFGGPQRHGNVFAQGAVVPFARGGVVGSPTLFGMSGGRTGLMGEAGPEAILPLTRVGNKLGVASSGASTYNVNINVHGARDARSFMDSREQIMRSISRGLRRVR